MAVTIIGEKLALNFPVIMFDQAYSEFFQSVDRMSNMWCERINHNVFICKFYPFQEEATIYRVINHIANCNLCKSNRDKLKGSVWNEYDVAEKISLICQTSFSGALADAKTKVDRSEKLKYIKVELVCSLVPNQYFSNIAMCVLSEFVDRYRVKHEQSQETDS